MIPSITLDPKKEKELIESISDPISRQILIVSNLKLVAYVAKRFTTSADTLDDLISIGTIGLIKGVNTFSNGNGNQLSTYLFHCIRNEMRKYFRSIKNYVSTISFETPIHQEDGDPILLQDLIGSNPDELYEKVELELKIQELQRALNTLSVRERSIIELRYFNGLNFRAIGNQVGCTRQNVSLMEKKIIKKLRRELVW